MFWVHPIATEMIRKIFNLSRNTNKLFWIINPLTEDKGQPLVLTKTKVCVKQKIFSRVKHQKK